jgi:hypothetical protein
MAGSWSALYMCREEERYHVRRASRPRAPLPSLYDGRTDR